MGGSLPQSMPVRKGEGSDARVELKMRTGQLIDSVGEWYPFANVRAATSVTSLGAETQDPPHPVFLRDRDWVDVTTSRSHDAVHALPTR